MNTSELKWNVENVGTTDTYFFTRKTMQFFGDTMRNYGVRSTTILTDWGENGEYLGQPQPIEVWELYRRQPVKHGLDGSAYFHKVLFNRVFQSHREVQS
jgi:hypothetical protein